MAENQLFVMQLSTVAVSYLSLGFTSGRIPVTRNSHTISRWRTIRRCVWPDFGNPRKSPEGSELETFAILTTAANKLVEPIHDRMPVTLDTFSLWLSHNMHDPEQLQPLYLPFPAAEMTTYKVPDLVNNPRFRVPRVFRPGLTAYVFSPLTQSATVSLG